jgi:hypothetical protein
MAISLSSIRKTAIKPPIIALHGTAGIGKTTFASQAPNAVFISTEDGHGSIVADSFPIAQNWTDVFDAMSALYQEPHDYKTVVIDSLSALEPLIWKQVAADHKKTNIEELGYGRGYVFALDYWQQLLAGCAALRDEKGIIPILIAHSDVVRFDSPEVEPYERHQIRLHKRAMALVYERCDIIGFANWRTVIVKDEVGIGQKQSRGVGTGERLLHLVEKPAYLAKNRYSLPETIPLSWQAFSTAMAAAMPAPAEQQPTQQPQPTDAKKRS